MQEEPHTQRQRYVGLLVLFLYLTSHLSDFENLIILVMTGLPVSWSVAKSLSVASIKKEQFLHTSVKFTIQKHLKVLTYDYKLQLSSPFEFKGSVYPNYKTTYCQTYPLVVLYDKVFGPLL